MVTAAKREAKQLGQILLEDGLLTQEQLERALEQHRSTPKSLGRVLIDLGFIRERDLVRALARQVGLDFVDLTAFPIDAVATTLVPQALSRRYRALPIAERGGTLLVAMADPEDVHALDDIRALTGRDVRPVVASASDIEEAIDRHGLPEDQVGAAVAIPETPTVELVTSILTQAIADRASDIHIEPTDTDVRVRVRVDGVLHEMMHPPKRVHDGLLNVLKVMAELDIAERRLPQDGRIGMKVDDRRLDLHVATLPTVYGEKLVIRILDEGRAPLQLPDLGFNPLSLERFEAAYRKLQGAILVTGPSGSGKSTTLYATLDALNDVDRNIVTIEDAVEQRLPGINQLQVDAEAGLTMVSALRSILHGDPDVVMIGEIRDREAAMLSIEAARTGRLILSTLHTDDAPSAMTRLTEMRVEPFLVASAVECVVAQRLARKLCGRCRTPYAPERDELVGAGVPESRLDAVGELFHPTGCSACSNTGYRGRVSLFEVMPVTEEIRRLTVERASSEAIRAVATQQGMMTLRDDGIDRALRGATSLDEIARVLWATPVGSAP